MIFMQLITLTTIIPSLINPDNSTTSDYNSTITDSQNSITLDYKLPESDQRNENKSFATETLVGRNFQIKTTVQFDDENENKSDIESTLKFPLSSTSSATPFQIANEIRFARPQPTTAVQRPKNPSSSTTERIVFEDHDIADDKPMEALKRLNCSEVQTEYNGTCHKVLQQRPCPSGQWLVEDEDTGMGKCVENKCSGKPETAFYEGQCIKIRSEEPCRFGMRTYIEKSGNVDCDCKSGHLYSESDGNCYEAYRQGPCPKSMYFAIPAARGDTIRPKPTCIPNPCVFDGYFCNAPKCPLKKMRGMSPTPESLPRNCVKFGTPCTQTGRGLFTIHPDSNSPFCLENISDISNADRVIGNVPTLRCAPGSRRDILGNCRVPTVIQFS